MAAVVWELSGEGRVCSGFPEPLSGLWIHTFQGVTRDSGDPKGLNLGVARLDEIEFPGIVIDHGDPRETSNQLLDYLHLGLHLGSVEDVFKKVSKPCPVNLVLLPGSVPK
jgi:hypothetical protein